MAQIIKRNKPTIGKEVVRSVIHVARGALSLPQTTTQLLFKVSGGRILVHLLLLEVTTVIQSSDPVLKVSASKLNAALDTLVGTAYDIASTLDISSDEVGTMYTVEGDGTALVSPQVAGAGYGAQGVKWICPQGQIYLTTGASKTGALKADIWYEALDEGVSVISFDTATVAVT